MTVKKKEVTPNLGKTISRLRKAYNFSLGDLSEQSGVAKSIISQIEKNETNPTLSTIWKLSQALDTSLEEVLRDEDRPNFIEKLSTAAIPVLTSEDSKVTLKIIGWIKLVDSLQIYDMHAEPGGVLESEPHADGSIESLSLFSGELEVMVNGETRHLKAGETLRYRGDVVHKITNVGKQLAHATMVNLLKFSA